jgi:CRISPR-associated protein Csm5
VEQYLTLCLRARDLSARVAERRAFDRADVHREVLAQTLGVSEEQARHYQQTLYRILNIREERLGEPRTWRDFQRRLGSLGRSREWLGQHVEHMVLGHNPNHDLMRAVQVSDTAPMDLGRLAVGLVWTYTLRGNQLVEKREQDGDYKAFVEWLTPDTTLRLTLRLDDFLFTEAANRELRFRGAKAQAVQQLAHTCNAYARTLITAEREFYATYSLDILRDLYAELETTLNVLPEGAFLLNIGWGGGWEVKTIGDLLHKALGEDGFRQLRQRYRLGVAPRTGQLTHSAPFPKTRRIAYEGGAARWALGWVKVEPQKG